MIPLVFDAKKVGYIHGGTPQEMIMTNPPKPVETINYEGTEIPIKLSMEEVDAILNELGDSKPDVIGYVKPLCRSCQFWKQNENSYRGYCSNVTFYEQTGSNETTANFGCINWKAKNE